VRAGRVYELIVHKGPRLDPERIDHIEVLDIASGEVELFWDTFPDQTGKLARALRADLASMDAGEFIATWRRYEL
jgi:hypothetical protein